MWAVGLFDWFASRSKGEGKLAQKARAREIDGDLAEAAALYQEADLPDEAARVLLLRAEAEPAIEKRIALFGVAAATATNEELREKAQRRKAVCSFDLLRDRAGALMKGELLTVARELEEVGELEKAADAYALAGDAEAEIRALTAAGAIERLEERLRASEAEARREAQRESRLRKITDLDRVAERRAALELAREALSFGEDDRVVEIVRRMKARLIRGPIASLEIEGALLRVAFGREVTIGRGEATIVIASRAVSRCHLRIYRGEGGAWVEDLGSRNGTTLAGARLAASVPVREGIELLLGGEVPCAIKPRAGASSYEIEIGGASYVAPLGELEVCGFLLDYESVGYESVGEDGFVVLRSQEGMERPFLGEYLLAPTVELSIGDEIRMRRGGPVVLRVPTEREAMAGEGTDEYARGLV